MHRPSFPEAPTMQTFRLAGSRALPRPCAVSMSFSSRLEVADPRRAGGPRGGIVTSVLRDDVTSQHGARRLRRAGTKARCRHMSPSAWLRARRYRGPEQPEGISTSSTRRMDGYTFLL